MKAKKFLALLLTMLLLLTACSGEPKGSKTSNDDKAAVDQKETTEEKADEETTEAEKEQENLGYTFPERVIYDENNIKITVEEFTVTDNMDDLKIPLLIENNADYTVGVQSRNENINNIMIDPIFSAEAAPGKKARDEMKLYDIEDIGVSSIESIEFNLHFFDSDDYSKDSFDSDVVVLDSEKEKTQKYLNEGALLYEDESIVVNEIELQWDDDGDASFLNCFYNKTDEPLTIQVRDFSVNGFMTDCVFSLDIAAKKYAYDDIRVRADDLEVNKITAENIESAEFKFAIISDNFDTKKTEFITINYSGE